MIQPPFSGIFQEAQEAQAVVRSHARRGVHVTSVLHMVVYPGNPRKRHFLHSSRARRRSSDYARPNTDACGYMPVTKLLLGQPGPGSSREHARQWVDHDPPSTTSADNCLSPEAAPGRPKKTPWRSRQVLELPCPEWVTRAQATLTIVVPGPIPGSQEVPRPVRRCRITGT